MTTNDTEYKFSDQFLEDFKKYTETVDEVAKSLFNGDKLDELRKDFFAKHDHYMRTFPFTVSWSKFPNVGYYEAVEEDKRILNSDKEDSNNNKKKEFSVPQVTPEYAKILGDVYWRACGSAYLKLTLAKSRDNIELNRLEVVQLGRYAIRYDPNGWWPNYWFMICVGYYVQDMTNPKERSLVGNVFMHSTLKCQRMNPKDYLCHSLYGRFLYNIASLNWIERKVVQTFVSEKVQASYEEAEKAFLHANSLRGDWLPTGLWIARCLLAQKRPLEEVKKWIDLSLSFEVLEPTSEIERRQCLELQSKLKLSN